MLLLLSLLLSLFVLQLLLFETTYGVTPLSKDVYDHGMNHECEEIEGKNQTMASPVEFC
uniref:Uncharacterized protein n=1 Tax=Octopus bimaculoides TaxID=37653 RepID=A0A0L8IE28_OCTBM